MCAKWNMNKDAWMHSWRLCTSMSPPRHTVTGFVASVETVEQSRRFYSDKWRHDEDVYVFRRRHHNPAQTVALSSSHSLALGGMYGRRGGRSGGWMNRWRARGDSLEVVSLDLFGEFADDSDQSTIFIFQTLVVCSQVDQNLEEQVKAQIKPLNLELVHFKVTIWWHHSQEAVTVTKVLCYWAATVWDQ